jgi:hypothetical protein
MDETTPAETHVCVDGKTKPGKGANAKPRCRDCHAAAERERRAKNRDAKPMLAQAKMTRGNGGITATHGFYRKKLKGDELLLAEQIHAKLKADYPELDDTVDDIMLHLAIVNLVKLMRDDDPVKKGDKFVDVNAAREKAFQDIMDRLALSRRARKEDGTKDDLAEAMRNYFPARKPVAKVDAPKDDLKPAP